MHRAPFERVYPHRQAKHWPGFIFESCLSQPYFGWRSIVILQVGAVDDECYPLDYECSLEGVADQVQTVDLEIYSDVHNQVGDKKVGVEGGDL
jgi:hypothetical protein